MKNKADRKLKILLIIKEPIGSKLNAMGIRYLEFAKFLNSKYSVELIAPCSDGNTNNFDFSYTKYSLKYCVLAIHKADILIVTNPHPLILLVSRLFRKKIILDLYDPALIENLEQIDFLPAREKQFLYSIFVNWVKLQIRLSDYYLCANERQKDLWLGTLALLGKLNPESYSMCRNANGLITLIPTGIPNESAAKSEDVLKGVIPGISKTDKVLLWVGAPSTRYDEKLAIHTMCDIAKTREDIKLIFICGSPDNSDILKEDIRLADSLGLTDKTIFFIKEWIPYEKIANYYLEADLGISLHHCHLETHFSMRNRVLGYLWAGLPVIVTEGDILAELVTRKGLGLVVKEGNKEQFSEAITKLVDDEHTYGCCKDAISKTLPDYRWGNILLRLEKAVDFSACLKSHRGRFELTKSLCTLFSLMIKCFFYRIRYGIVRSKLDRNCTTL